MARATITKFEKGVREIQDREAEITATLDKIKSDVGSMGKESHKALEKFDRQLRALATFAREPIGSKWL